MLRLYAPEALRVLIMGALKGDKYSASQVIERAWGKAVQPILGALSSDTFTDLVRKWSAEADVVEGEAVEAEAEERPDWWAEL